MKKNKLILLLAVPVLTLNIMTGCGWDGSSSSSSASTEGSSLLSASGGTEDTESAEETDSGYVAGGGTAGVQSSNASAYAGSGESEQKTIGNAGDDSGVAFNAPYTLAGLNQWTYGSKKGKSLKVIYGTKSGKQRITITKAKYSGATTTDDATTTIYGYTVYIKANKSGSSTAKWYGNGYRYTMTLTGIDATTDDIESYVRQVIALNMTS